MGALIENQFEHFRIEIGDAFDHVDAELPARFENFGILGVEKFGDSFFAAFFVFLQHGDAFRVTGDEILHYLAVRREWRTVVFALGFVAILAILPSLYFGFAENFNLLGQWFTQESRTQLGESEIWFPNQSLRGVFMRYLTVIDYSQSPDSNYAQVNFASMNPAAVRGLWMILAGGIYAGFLLLANRRRNSDGQLDHGLAFCLVALLEPFTQKYALAVLLWPAIAAAALTKETLFRGLLYVATVLALIQPLAPGATAQRFVQVLGMDFGATLLLTVTLALACLRTRAISTCGGAVTTL